MKNLLKILVTIILLNSGLLYSQAVSSVVPDTGTQGNSFPITVHGTGTEWTLSPYFNVYFDPPGVFANSIVTVNDTTLTGNIIIDGKSPIGFHKCLVVDQFFKFLHKGFSFLRISE